MYRGVKRYLSKSRRGRGSRLPYMKRSAYQTGPLISRGSGSGRMRSNMKKRRGSSRGSSIVMQYAKSLLNPSLTGARIPDDFCQPSASFQLEKEYIVKCTGSSVVMCLELGTLPSFGYYSVATTSNTAGTDKVIPLIAADGSKFAFDQGAGTAATPGGGKPMRFIGEKSDLNTLLSLYKSARLVSAGFRLQYSGSDASNQGIVSVGYLNREYFGHGEEVAKVDDITASATARKTYITATGTTEATTENFFGLTTTSTVDDLGEKVRSLPVNAYGPAKDGAYGRYFPLDNDDIEFRELANAEFVTSAFMNVPIYNASNRHIFGNVSEWNFTGNNIDYGAFIIVGEKLVGASCSFVIKVTCNFEGQIRGEALNLVSTRPSPVSSGAMAKASKIYGKAWQCRVGNEMPTRSV